MMWISRYRKTHRTVNGHHERDNLIMTCSTRTVSSTRLSMCLRGCGHIRPCSLSSPLPRLQFSSSQSFLFLFAYLLCAGGHGFVCSWSQRPHIFRKQRFTGLLSILGSDVLSTLWSRTFLEPGKWCRCLMWSRALYQVHILSMSRL